MTPFFSPAYSLALDVNIVDSLTHRFVLVVSAVVLVVFAVVAVAVAASDLA